MKPQGVRFENFELEGERMVSTSVRFIKQSDLRNCPHCIFAPEHYRNDGSCKCSDPHAKEMAEWGYRWNDQLKVWE